MRAIRLAALAPIVLASVLAAAQMSGYNPSKSADQSAEEVSLVRLIANPQAYDGRKIRVIGFLNLEFEGDAIYLHREDFEYGITENAFWVDVPQDMTVKQRTELNLRFVICEGRFVASRHGHMGMFGGEITNITRLEPWEARRPDGLPPPAEQRPR